MAERELNEYIINEKLPVGMLVERDGVLYRCESCTWLEDTEEAMDAASEIDQPFLGWNATLLERPTSAQTPMGWLWQELASDLSEDRLATLRASFNAHNQVYQKSRTADKRALQLKRTKEQKHNIIVTYTARLATTTEPSSIKFLKKEIAKAQSYLSQRGDNI